MVLTCCGVFFKIELILLIITRSLLLKPLMFALFAQDAPPRRCLFSHRRNAYRKAINVLSVLSHSIVRWSYHRDVIPALDAFPAPRSGNGTAGARVSPVETVTSHHALSPPYYLTLRRSFTAPLPV